MADVIVIGAGIVGSACAWRLAGAGLRVQVFDSGDLGRQASQAALGLLSFHARSEHPPALYSLASASRQLYPPIVGELTETVGEEVPYHQTGHLHVALSEIDEQELQAGLALNRAHGFACEPVDPAGCLALEPGLTPEVRGGLLYPEDACVDNRALAQAIALAARSVGVEFVRAEVESVAADSGVVRGVRAGGEFYPSEWVILAAGCWSGTLPGVPPLPIEPRRGQALALAGPLVQRVVSGPRVYFVPRGKDETLVGATVERAGYDLAVTVAGLYSLLQAGQELMPGLPTARFVRAWAGLRPGTPDGLPVIGPFAELPNLVAATGHFRDGILLAPITAELVRQVVVGETPQVDLAPFSPDRATLRSTA